MKTNSLDFDAQTLKEKILDLAMRGKLVPQNPNDEPASVLLKKIKAEKERLIKEKKIRKTKPLPPISDDEEPFDIPNSWEWVRWGDFLDVRDGTHDTPKYVKTGIPLVTAKNLKKGEIDFSNTKNISREDADEINKRSRVDNGDVIFAMIGTIGNPVQVKTNIEFVIKNVALLKPICDIDMKFVCNMVLGLQDILLKNSSGGNQKFLSLRKINKLPFPLPPLKEQSQIAAKITQLFALLRKVESSIQEYAKIQTLLKSKILDLAMRGKLVKQDSNDEPASVLIEKIKLEKEKLIKEKKIKKAKPLPPITDDEKPFTIPKSWAWVRLGDIGEIFAGGDRPKDTSNIRDETHSVPVFSNGVKNAGLYGYTGVAKVRKRAITLSARGTVGHVELRNMPFTPIIRLISFIPYDEEVLQFAYYFLKNANLIKSGDGSSIPQLTVPALRPKLLPLPPVKEQRRIGNMLVQLEKYI